MSIAWRICLLAEVSGSAGHRKKPTLMASRQTATDHLGSALATGTTTEHSGTATEHSRQRRHPTCTENDDATKLRKRCNAISAIQMSDEYIFFPLQERPLGPNPYQWTMSKRRWEKSCMDWRAELHAEFYGCAPNTLESRTPWNVAPLQDSVDWIPGKQILCDTIQSDAMST